MRSIFRRLTVAGLERPVELAEAQSRLKALLASTDPGKGAQAVLAAESECSLAEAHARVAALIR